MSNQKQAGPLPASMKEAIDLGYCYCGGDCLADGAEFSQNDNVSEWTGEMEWEVYAPGEVTDLPHIHTRVRARFEFLTIEEGNAKLND